jgi:hypothetical protein
VLGACLTWSSRALTSLDDEQVLGVDVSVLGEVEVLLRDENAFCGDRVSACPYMQQSREFYGCAIAMARVEDTNLGRGTCE